MASLNLGHVRGADGKDGKDGVIARNLLDNSNFTNPVNQREQSSWGSDDVYSIDRWRAVAYVGASVSLGDSGITLTHTADGLAEIYQLFERYDDMSGHTYTVAVCVGGVWECVSFVMGDEDGGLQLPSGLTIYSVPSYHLIIRNEVGPESIMVERAALYEGEYTADTLPPYVPKGYAAELMECYRYFRKTVLHGVAETTKYIAPVNIFDPPFRIVPTITADTQFGAPGVGGPSASNISFVVYHSFVQEIVDNNNSLTPGILYRLYIQASADL